MLGSEAQCSSRGYLVDAGTWHSARVTVDAASGLQRAVNGFHRGCELAVGRLPWGLKSFVAPTFLGFALINGCTFAVDLLLLTALRDGLGLPLAVAVTISYVCAFGLSYVLNRIFNFSSHSAVGPQLAIYVVVVAVNYLAFILGVSTGLSALGVEYHVARITAGGCEAVFMYTAMRWVVFRR